MNNIKKSIINLPISLFGSIMGLSGLSVAYEQLSQTYNLFSSIGNFFSLFTITVFIFLTIAYLFKIIFFYESTKKEFQNPLTKSFFGTFIISLLLLPILIHKYSYGLAYILWLIGVFLMLIFSVYIVNFWIQTKHENSHLTPAWIIPVVGTLDIPLASHLFNIDTTYLNILSLSIGLFFTIPIVTLILSKIIFFEKLPQKLMPTLMILVAPFSVGYLAYIQVNKNLDNFAIGLFCLGFFIFLTLLPQLFKIAKCCPFKITWWAISFPIAALLNSVFSMSKLLNSNFLFIIGAFMLVIFSFIFLWLISKTLKGIFTNELANLT